MFCENCGAVLVPQREEGKVQLRCPKCGVQDKEVKDTSEYRVKSKLGKKQTETIVIKDALGDSGIEPVEGYCEKCGHDKIINWTVDQSQAEKERIIIFHRCAKCNYTWREIGD